MTGISEPAITVLIESATAGGKDLSGQTNIILPPNGGGPTGPADTVYLMNFDQAIGSQPPFDDTGKRTMNWGVNLNVEILADPKFGTGCFGADDPLVNFSMSAELRSDISSDMDISGQRDFCVQFWVKVQAMLSAVSVAIPFELQSFADNEFCNILMIRDSDTTFHFFISTLGDSGGESATGTTIFNVGVYYEVALSVIDNVFTLRVNGDEEASFDFGVNFFADTEFRTMHRVVQAHLVQIDSVRMVMDCGVFDADYAALSAPLEVITTCPI